MKIRDILFGICLGVGAAAIAAPNPNWLGDAITMYLPQSEIVRHPIDNGKYYLCWTDGVSRHGVAFRRTEMDQRIRSIPRASRASVASLMMTPPPKGSKAALATWSASDDKVCWPD